MSTHLEDRLTERRLDRVLLVLRFGLAAAFLASGLPKLLPGRNPVEEFLTATTPYLDPAWFVPTLGLAELGIGVSLCFRPLLPAALLLLAVHASAAALPLVTLPGVIWRAFPQPSPAGRFLLLTLVRIAAALALAGTALCRPSPGRRRTGERVPFRTAGSVFRGLAAPQQAAQSSPDLADTARIVTSRSRLRGRAERSPTLQRIVRRGP